MGDLFLSNKAIAQSFAPPEQQEIIRRTNEVTTNVVAEAGFYSNPLETIFKTLSIPQQVLYTFGKNLGEEIFQRELGNEGFFEEMSNAFTGKGNVTFNTVLKSFNLESLDMAMPEGFQIDSLALRLPVAVLAGLAAGFGSQNPVIGITAAFATNNFLSGQGIATSVADVVLDPLNKLRLFGKTAKGLGITRKVEKELMKQGRLDDLLTNGIVRVAKKGAKKAEQDIFEVVVRGKEEELFKAVSKGQFQKIGDDTYSVIANGFDEVTALKNAGKVQKFSTVIKKGEFAEEALDTIVADKTGLSLLGQLLKGERRLFDFKGNSGFIINDTNPFVGKILTGTPFRSIDVLNPIAYPAHILEYTLDGIGKTVSKIPKISKVADFEAAYLAPLTAKGNTLRKTIFAKVLAPGTDVGVKLRKRIEEDLKSGVPEVANKARSELPTKFGTDVENLNLLEKELVHDITRASNKDSNVVQETAFKIEQIVKNLKNRVVTELEKTTLGDLNDPQVLKAIEVNMKRWLDVRPDALDNVFEIGSKEYMQEIDKFLDNMADVGLAKTDLNSYIVKNNLIEQFLELEDVAEIQKFAEKHASQIESQIPSVTNSSLPLSKLLAVEQLPKAAEQTMKVSDDAQHWQMFTAKLDLVSKKIAAEEAGVAKNAKLKGLSEVEQGLVDALDQKKLGDLKSQKRAIDLFENAMSTTLNIKGVKDVGSVFNLHNAEIEIYQNAIKLLGSKNTEKIKFIFTNTEALGRSGEFEGAVADMIITAGIKDAGEAAIRISNTADVRDGVTLIGDYFLKTLDVPTKEKLLAMFGEGVEAQNKFLNLFTEIALSPKGLLNDMPAEQVGFIGKLIDGFRGFLSYTKSIFFGKKKFKNEELKKKLVDFMEGTELPKPLNTDGLFKKKIFIDESTGKLIDPEGMRSTLADTEAILIESGLMSKHGGISLTKDGAAYQDLLLKETDIDKQYKVGNKIASIDIANKGHVGARMYASYQKWLEPHDPDRNFFNPIYEQVVIKDRIISENMAREFQQLQDFSANSAPYQVATTIVNRVSAAYDAVPMSAFEEDLGLLLKSQSAVIRSREAVSSVEYIAKFSAYGDAKQNVVWKKKQLVNLFSRYNLAGDNTALDNDFYGKVLNEIDLWIKAASPEQMTDDVRDIKRILRDKRSINADEFKHLNDSIAKTEGDLQQHLTSYVNSFLEQAGDDLDKVKVLADQFLDKKTAEEFKGAMDSRYEALANPVAGGGLGKEISSVIQKNIEEVDGFSSVAQGMEKARIGSFSADFRRNNVTILDNADETFSKLKGYSVFKAPTNNPNPIARGMDGVYFPTSLHGVISQDPKVPYEQMTELGKLMDTLLSGASKGTSQRLAKKVDDSLFFGKLGIKGTRFVTDTIMATNYDYVLNLFKAHALLSPAFHARNGVSAFFVNSSHGVAPTDTLRGAEAALFLRRKLKRADYSIDSAGKVSIKNNTFTAKEVELTELIARSEKAGVLSSGRLQEITTDVANQKLDGGTLNPFSLDFIGIEKNAKTAGFIEDSVRMGALQHATRNLKYGIDDASDFVKLLHFDYNVLTDFEKSTMKRLIPFYTYSRKAISRDSRMFMERTGEFYALGKMVATIQSGSEPEKTEAVSSFIRDSLGVDVNVDENGKHSYLLLGGLIPAADFVGLAGKIGNDGILRPSESLKQLIFAFMRNAAPMIKTPVEQAFNWDFYFNKKITQVEGELADTFGISFDKRTASMLQSVRLIRDADKIYHASFNLKNVTRPNSLSPSETALGQFGGFLKTLGGVNIADNNNPADNLYFNSVLPTKLKFREAKRQIKRAVRKGFLPNIQNSVDNLNQLQRAHQEKTLNEAEALDRARNFTPPKK